MKKILILVLTLLMLVSCGKQAEEIPDNMQLASREDDRFCQSFQHEA